MTMNSPLRRLHSAVVEAEFYCQICLCNEKMAECWTLPCGHQFCKDCIAQYLTVKIQDANIINFKCPFIDDSLMNASGNGWNCAQCTFWNEGAVEPRCFRVLFFMRHPAGGTTSGRTRLHHRLPPFPKPSPSFPLFLFFEGGCIIFNLQEGLK
jgi:hypothetical protein